MSPFNTFFSAFTQSFDEVCLAAPVLGTPPAKGIPLIMPKEVKIVPLPEFYGNLDFIRRAPRILFRIITILKREIQKSDAVIVEHNGILELLAILEARKRKVAHLVLIGDDIKEVVKKKYTRTKKWINLFCFYTLDIIVRYFISKGLLTLVTGNKLLNEYHKKGCYVYTYFTSLISLKDIVEVKKNVPLLETANILYVGFLEANKGVQVLIKAYADFVKECNAYKSTLHIVGDGNYRSVLESLAQKLNINEKVKFYGFIGDREKVKRIFLNCDLLVLPSYSEGVPKVLLEAMAYGVPILATNVGGIPDIINDGINGLLIPPGNAEELKKGIIKILSNNQLYQYLRANGFHFIKAHTMEKQAEKIVMYLTRYGTAYLKNMWRANLIGSLARTIYEKILPWMRKIK